MRKSGELLRFHLREAALYEVDEYFPRLRKDFRPPSGVLSVRYAISLANLPSLGVDEVIEMLKDSQGLVLDRSRSQWQCCQHVRSRLKVMIDYLRQGKRHQRWHGVADLAKRPDSWCR